jgi:hypothetical protein
MTEPLRSSEPWISCPPGALSAFAAGDRARQRRKFLVRAGETLGVLTVVSAGAWLVLQRTGALRRPGFGGIACAKVRELAPQFIRAELDDSTTRRITAHLEHCSECRKFIAAVQTTTACRPQPQRQEGCQCAAGRRQRLLDALAGASSPNNGPSTLAVRPRRDA